MRTTSVTLFCKQATCPSAETLLSFHAREFASEQSVWVEEHLGSCEFCGAELRLLSEHKAPEEEHSTVQIPAHLRSLAEALLGQASLSRLFSLSEPSYEKERLTLTDA
jgi:hypothetical protein